MALDFNASGRYVSHGSPAALDDIPSTYGALSVWAWVRRTANGANQHIITKDGAFPSGWSILADNLSATEGRLRFLVFRGATDANWTDFISASAVIPLDRDIFVAAVHDESGSGSTRVRLYVGSLTEPATEITSFTRSQGGSGSATSDAAYNLYVGNLSRATTLPFKGAIARAGVHGRILTLDQLRRIQRTAWIERVRDIGPGCLLAADYLTGDPTQRDHSGRGHHGTVTGGATVVAHLPLSLLSVPRPPPPRLAHGGGGTNYTLTADPGTTAVTGTAAALKWARKLAASAGTAVATGTAASLEWGREVTGAAGTAVITTVTAILRWFRKLFGAAGTAEVTGTDATLSRTRVLTADPGAVEVTGTAATLAYSGDTGGGVNAKRQRMMMMGVTRLWWLLLFSHLK
jgi:hypothetical protein